jgi:uncharacterized YigZ family protein
MNRINNNDVFLQVKEPARGELKIRGSRFIALVKKVTTEEEAGQAIAEVIKEFRDATHHCYAWRVGHGRSLKYRYSDNGEPNHTAGLPIFKAIENRNLSNILVVVVRYFGGIKLGTGGLIRAYTKVTNDLLKECEIEKNFQVETVMFKTSFEFVSLVHNIIATFKATLKDSSFGENVVFTVDIRQSKYKEFLTKLKDATNGQVEIVR